MIAQSNSWTRLLKQLITFDKDLLSLKKYKDIQIAQPSMVKYWFPKNAG